MVLAHNFNLIIVKILQVLRKMSLKQFVIKSSVNPKKLFAFDGFGALLSAFLLGVVLVKYELFFGIPKQQLYILATVPCFFAIYDFYCYWQLDSNFAVYLKIIAIVNLLYGGASIAFSFYHRTTITSFGWLYLIIEIVIVSGLAIIELKVANGLLASQSKNNN